MVAVNSLLYFLFSAGLSSNPDQAQDYDTLNGMDLAKLCPPTEHLSNCEAHCQKNCTNFNKPFLCTAICIKGCVCDEGLVRAANGKCIQPTQCPGKDTCPRGEHYDQCNAHCQRNCTTWGNPLPCPRICVHGYVCDRGTIRGPNGKCIKPDKCPKKSFSEFESEESEDVSSTFTCPPDEDLSRCFGHCQKNCSNYDQEIPCRKICVLGCVCKEGFTRGPNGRCIEIENCPEPESQSVSSTFTCPPDEDFSRCFGHCQKNCSNYDEEIPCRKICVRGCVCKEGFTRGPNGRCIEIENCPEPESQSVSDAVKKCPPKQHMSECEAHCQKNCTNFNKPFPCTKMCVRGCVCDEGLVRAADGKCVAPKQCPGKDVCPRGEHYNQCNSYCQRNCTTWGKPLPCPLMCVHGCVCDIGTVRGPKGKCIKPDKCPKKSFSEFDSEEEGPVSIEADFCPENEEFSRCKANCQGNCRYRVISCAGVCVPGCICKEGYVRGPKGNCILPRECTSKEIPREFICPTNEHFGHCNAHCQEKCTTKDKTILCPHICVSGCICDHGYSRGMDGKCILRDQCPSRNEMSTFSEEIASSQEESTRIYEEISSQEEEIRSQDEFVPDVRECPINKHYDRCNYQCQRNCSNWERENISCPRICAAGCVCDLGFVRGPDGSCIKPEKCSAFEDSHSPLDQIPIPILCSKNEVFVPCPCPLDCDNYETKKCYFCIPGCQCKPGYVKGTDGTCIKKEECPRKKPDECTELEFYDSCGSACPDDCTNYNQQDRQCTKNCVIGCFCIPGFVRGPNGDCIFPFECPAKAPLFH